jgi:dynein regulatory complex protein 1
MTAYNKILNERWQKSHKIDSLEKQNGELKQLLRGYLSSKVNEEFQVPPSQVLLDQAGMLR